MPLPLLVVLSVSFFLLKVAVRFRDCDMVRSHSKPDVQSPVKPLKVESAFGDPNRARDEPMGSVTVQLEVQLISPLSV